MDSSKSKVCNCKSQTKSALTQNIAQIKEELAPKIDSCPCNCSSKKSGKLLTATQTVVPIQTKSSQVKPQGVNQKHCDCNNTLILTKPIEAKSKRVNQKPCTCSNTQVQTGTSEAKLQSVNQKPFASSNTPVLTKPNEAKPQDINQKHCDCKNTLVLTKSIELKPQSVNQNPCACSNTSVQTKTSEANPQSINIKTCVCSNIAACRQKFPSKSVQNIEKPKDINKNTCDSSNDAQCCKICPSKSIKNIKKPVAQLSKIRFQLQEIQKDTTYTKSKPRLCLKCSSKLAETSIKPVVPLPSTIKKALCVKCSSKKTKIETKPIEPVLIKKSQCQRCRLASKKVVTQKFHVKPTIAVCECGGKEGPCKCSEVVVAPIEPIKELEVEESKIKQVQLLAEESEDIDKSQPPSVMFDVKETTTNSSQTGGKINLNVSKMSLLFSTKVVSSNKLEKARSISATGVKRSQESKIKREMSTHKKK